MAWNWVEIFKVLVVPISTAVLTTGGVLFTGVFGYWNQDRSQDIQMVNIGLSILGGENKDTSEPGRKFALRLLEKYADVEIPDAEFESWAQKGTLPKDIYLPPTKSSWKLKSGRTATYDEKTRSLLIEGEGPKRDPFLIDPNESYGLDDDWDEISDFFTKLLKRREQEELKKKESND